MLLLSVAVAAGQEEETPTVVAKPAAYRPPHDDEDYRGKPHYEEETRYAGPYNGPYNGKEHKHPSYKAEDEYNPDLPYTGGHVSRGWGVRGQCAVVLYMI